MYQIVRRPSDAKPAETALQFVARKAKRFESAFVTLAAANLFLASSAFSFYLFIHNS